MKRSLVLAVGAAIIIAMTYGASSISAARKVLMCHVEGNGSAHVIDISDNAVPAHLAHGDSEAAAGQHPGESCQPFSGGGF